MVKYLIRRLGYLVFVVFVISLVLFGISKLMPGDPAIMALEGGRKLKPEQREKRLNDIRERLGLNQSIPVQYVRWMGNMLTGNFGYSEQSKAPVVQMAKAPLLNTVRLNVAGMILTLLITIPLGVFSAVKRGKAADKTIQVISVLGYSLPDFIWGLVFICLFAIIFQIFPVSGTAALDTKYTGFAKFMDDMKYLALPLMTYVFSSLGSLTRYIRAAMLDALSMDYIRTARSKGLRERVVILSHAFRNSLIPFVTIVTGWFFTVFGGSIIIESVFSYNGMGKVMIFSLRQQDFAVVLTFYTFYALMTIAGNVVMDIGYCLVDPRVRLE